MREMYWDGGEKFQEQDFWTLRTYRKLRFGSANRNADRPHADKALAGKDPIARVSIEWQAEVSSFTGQSSWVGGREQRDLGSKAAR